MKRYFIIAISIFFLAVGCNPNDEVQDVNNIIISWHLTNTSGGLAGVNDDFELNTVVWNFNYITSTLTVSNSNIDIAKQDFLDSGEYSFSFLELNGSKYIFIDGIEYGLITDILNTNEFTIDENIKSTGNTTDGFIYTLKNVITVN